MHPCPQVKATVQYLTWRRAERAVVQVRETTLAAIETRLQALEVCIFARLPILEGPTGVTSSYVKYLLRRWPVDADKGVSIH